MPGWRSRGYLPHFDGTEVFQHITFHLGDSLPLAAVQRMQQELLALPEFLRPVQRRKRVQELLDAGRGRCPLRHPCCASIVQDALMHGDGDRYLLLAWVIMPNHVHVLIQQSAWPLAKVVQSWKRHSARLVRRQAPSLGVAIDREHPFWQRDYWDRFIRNERHYRLTLEYIAMNPVRAGLAKHPQHWPWSSSALQPNALA